MGEVPKHFSSKKAAIASDQLYEGTEFRDHHEVGASLALLDRRLDEPFELVLRGGGLSTIDGRGSPPHEPLHWRAKRDPKA